MIPQVLELLARSASKPRLGKSRQQQRKKASVRFWTFRFRYHSRNRDASPAQATCRAPASRPSSFTPASPCPTLMIRADSAGRYYNAYTRGREG
jgi:hypothetical protein